MSLHDPDDIDKKHLKDEQNPLAKSTKSKVYTNDKTPTSTGNLNILWQISAAKVVSDPVFRRPFNFCVKPNSSRFLFSRSLKLERI